MITSETDGVKNFVIATPTKCGTTTLEEMCRRHGGGRVSRGGVEVPSFRIMSWEQPRRQHRMALPSGDGWGEADRYLMVRNPYLRYMSQYEYLRAPHNYSKFGAAAIQGREWRGWNMGRVGYKHAPLRFDQFLYFIADARKAYASGRWSKKRGQSTSPVFFRSPWVWLDSLSDSQYYLAMQPGGASAVTLIMLEHFWEAMGELKARYGLKTLSVRPTIRANRTLTYHPSGARGYWSGIHCSARVFSVGRGEYMGPRDATDPECECAACAIGVADEAIAFGYVQ